jgi:uncharacterized membrane protein YwzB
VFLCNQVGLFPPGRVLQFLGELLLLVHFFYLVIVFWTLLSFGVKCEPYCSKFQQFYLLLLLLFSTFHVDLLLSLLVHNLFDSCN